jgi:hypothetical protein
VTVWSAGLALRARVSPCPKHGQFEGEGAVLWLRRPGTCSWLEPLRLELDAVGRLWEPRFEVRPVPRADARGNPWSHRPDLSAPLRWGVVEEDVRDLQEMDGSPQQIAGLVIDGVLQGLGNQASRVLLGQAAALLPEDAPWLLCEPNGAALAEVVRNLRRDETRRGEGRGTVRTVRELRRLLESAGLGITEAWGLPPGDGLMRRLRLPGSAGWTRLFLEGRRVVAVGE